LFSDFIGLYFFGRPLKTFKPDGDFRSKLNTRMRILCEGHFKGLSPCTTPFAKRNFLRIVELRIPEVTALSIQKRGCENYLFIQRFVRGKRNAYMRSLPEAHGPP
jgi:hypothetical protein